MANIKLPQCIYFILVSKEAVNNFIFDGTADCVKLSDSIPTLKKSQARLSVQSHPLWDVYGFPVRCLKRNDQVSIRSQPKQLMFFLDAEGSYQNLWRRVCSTNLWIATICLKSLGKNISYPCSRENRLSPFSCTSWRWPLTGTSRCCYLSLVMLFLSCLKI